MSNERQVLCIPAWFDPERGHEMPVKTARDPSRAVWLKGSLSFYFNRIHQGNGRAALRERFGREGEHCAVSIYERLCQLSASRPNIYERGRILDQFGAPHTILTLAHAIGEDSEWLGEQINHLISVNWLAWIDQNDELPSQPVRKIRKCSDSFGTIPKNSENIAMSGNLSSMNGNGERRTENENENGEPGSANALLSVPSDQPSLFDQLRELDRTITRGQFDGWIGQYGEEAIQGALFSTIRAVKTKAIKSQKPGAYLTGCLRGGKGGGS